MKCLNFDGGFGCIPGAESHSGQVNRQLLLYYVVSFFLSLFP